MPGTRIKICCIQSLEEATLAVEFGADALGLVSAMPSGPGVISEASIATIAAGVAVDTFLLTSLRDAGAIAEQHHRCGTRTVQIVDRLASGSHADLRHRLPGVALVQVIHVGGDDSMAEASEVGPRVDALLLDSGRPGLAVPELGGTGRTHDWATSRCIRDASPVPVWLAGGLQPANVAEAIERVRPHGVDVCSGVRTDGRLDAVKLGAFVRAVRSWG